MKKYGTNDRYAIHVFNTLKNIDKWYFRVTKKAAENVASKQFEKNGDGTICIITDNNKQEDIATYC